MADSAGRKYQLRGPLDEGPSSLSLIVLMSRSSQRRSAGRLSSMLIVFGACAVTFMVMMYALERRGRGFILAFACGCALSSAYGFLAGTWPFGIVEAIWAAIAIRRYLAARDATNDP